MSFLMQNPRLIIPPHLPRKLLHISATSSPTLPSSSSILSIRHSLLSRRQTASDIIADYLRRLHHLEPQLRSFLHVSDSAARAAEDLDRSVAEGRELPPLAGVLVGVKDNICTVDMPTTGGSRILEGYRPAFDGTAVRRIREAGGIVVGKTNLDEFGMGSSTEASGFQVWEVNA